MKCFICKREPTQEELDDEDGLAWHDSPLIWCPECFEKCPPPKRKGTRKMLGMDMPTYETLPYYLMSEEDLAASDFNPQWVLDPEMLEKEKEAKERARQVKKEHRAADKAANMERMLTDLKDSPWVN